MRRAAPHAKRPPPLSPKLRQLVDRAYRSREKQVGLVVARCRRLYPHYRALSGSALDDLRKNIRLLVAGFYRQGLIEGRTPTPAELKGPIHMARLRATQGVPLDEMVGCYQLGLPILWAALIEKAGKDTGLHLELLRRVPVTISALTPVTTAVTEAYVEERERLLSFREQATDEFLRLLVAEDVPLGLVETRASALPVRLDAPRIAMFCRVRRRGGEATDGAGLEAEVNRLREILASAPTSAHALIGRIAEGLLAVLVTGPDREQLTEICRNVSPDGCRIGIGRHGVGLADLRRSAREAMRAAEIGELLRLQGPAHRHSELALFDLLDVGTPRALDFARRALGPLASPGSGETYRKTLRALCQNGFRLKVAAAALGVHPHTLSYRTGRLKERFGIDLDDSDTRLRVQLALLILDASGTPATG